MNTIKVTVSGRVQGVGFRNFVKSYADSLDVSGYARNLSDSRVQVFLQGADAAVDTVLNHIKVGPRYSMVTTVNCEKIENAAIQNGFITG